MVRETLTAQERRKHEKAIARLRQKLFDKREPSAYFIIPGSERILEALAESRWNAACGHYRLLQLGGLTYALDCSDPRGPAELGISHIEHDLFSLWICRAQGHTAHSSTVAFEALDDRVHDLVCSFRNSIVNPVYTMKRPKR
ncbi:MAG: hypothetical protein RBS02_15395 [Steroidobacteraceae bacterium]|jgi:hypothetical protein|nr:hypothetical protein [Steroidobacteraceae bacterium]